MARKKKTQAGRASRKKTRTEKDKKHHLVSGAVDERPEDFYSILESLPDIVYRIDPQGNFTFINNSIRILGYEPTELIGKHFSTIVHTDDAGYLSRHSLLPHYEGQTTGHQGAPKLFDERRTGRRRTRGLEIRLLPKKADRADKKSKKVIGSVIAFGDVTSAGYYSTGVRTKKRKFLGTLGIIRDITERRRAEEKLRYQADLLQNVSDAIISTDLNFVIRTWNSAAERLYGWKAFEAIGMNANTLTHQRFPDDNRKNVMKRFMDSGYWRGEITQRRKDGSELNVLTSLSLIKNSAGTAAGMVSVNRDITERKKAEIALAIANERLKKLQQVTTAAHSTLDISTVFKRVSNGFIDTLNFNTALIFMKNKEGNGYEVKSISAKRGIISKINAILGHSVARMKIPIDSHNEALRAVQQDEILIRNTLAEIVYPFVNKKMCTAIERLRRSKKYIVIPIRIGNEIAGGVFLTSPRNEVSEAELNIATLFTRAAANAINNANLHIQTIEAERALRESEARWRSLTEHSPDHILMLDIDASILYMNRPFPGQSSDDIIGRSFYEYAAPENRSAVRKTVEDVRTTGKAATIEHTIKDEGGSFKYFELHIGPVLHGGKVTSLITRSADVSERKKQEERLTKSLEEKEALLREIHHRVKNNLQIIYSLLNLQVGYLDSTRYKRLFQECQDRIKSMVLIHETLYQSENLADVNPVEYVNSLIKYLSHTYSIQKQNIRINTHIDKIDMDIDTAIPCGLIINELVSNAVKYAFTGNVHKQIPEITIILKKDADHRLRLTIADNGKGLPAGLDCEHTRTLGLQLVSALTQQLRGTLDVQRINGTVFTILFPYRS